MSRSIDQRIVEMKFENGKFKNDIKDTIDSLEKLKKETDFSKLKDSAKEFDLSKARNEVNTLGLTFKEVFKLTAFANISDSIQKNIVGAFKNASDQIISIWNRTFNIIKNKGWNRAANLEQAQFQLEGLSIAWESVSKQIDNAVTGTAYGLDSAARAASQLAASGVKIGQGFKYSSVIEEDVDAMERALGAISGIAAMTNSTYDEIADIFTDAAGRGKVSADTFNRIAQRGLNSAAELAKAMGVSETAVRDMARKGKISFQEFADAMYDAYYAQAKKSNETFDGALANMQAALGRIGAEFATPIRKGLIEPFNEVRLLINKVKSTMASSGLFEYFSKLTQVGSKLFSNFIKGFREGLGNLSSVYYLTMAFKAAVNNLINVIIPIKDAFKNVFGADLIHSINETIRAFTNFVKKLKPTTETMGYIRIAFEGFFQILKSIGKFISAVISGITGLNVEGTSLLGWLLRAVAIGLKVIGVFSELAVEMFDIQGAIELVSNALNFLIKNIGTIVTFIGGAFLSAVFAISSKLEGFATILRTIVVASFEKAVEVIRTFFTTFSENLNKFNGNVFLAFFKTFTDSLKSFALNIPSAISGIKNFLIELNVIDKIKGKFVEFGNAIKSFISILMEGLSTLGVVEVQAATLGDTVEDLTGTGNSKWDISGIQNFIVKLKEFIKNIDFGKIAMIGFIALITSIILNVRKLIKSVTTATDAVSGVFGGVKRLMDTVGTAFSSMTNTVGGSIKNYLDTLAEAKKHKTTLAEIASSLLKLSGAIAVLVASLMTLSLFSEKHDLGGAGKTLALLGVGILSFTAALAILNKKADLGFLVKFSATMLAMAASMAILVSAMNSMKLDGIETKMAVLGILMGELALVATLLSKYANQLIKGSLSLVSFALTLKILAAALNVVPGLIDMSGEIIILGTLLYGASMLLGKAATSFAATIKEFAIAMAAMGASILLFVISARILNEIPDISNGLLNLALIMGEVLAFSYLMIRINKTLGDNEMPKFNASMLILAAAVSILARSVKMLGQLDPNDCIQGTLAMTALLGMIAVLMKVSEHTEKAHPIKFAASLVLITGCVALLGGLVALIGLIKLPQLLKGTAIVAALLGLVAGLAFVSKFTEKANFKAITAALVAINVIMVEIMILSMAKDWTGITKALGVMTAVILAFGGIMYAIGQSKFDKNTAMALLAMTVVVGEIGLALYVLSTQCDWPSLLLSVVAISTVLITFGNLMSTLSRKTGLKPEKMKTFLAGTLVLIPIALSLYALSTQNWASIAASGAAISAALYVFSKVLSNISSMKGIKMEKMQAFLLASTAFIPIGAALWLASNNSWSSILAAGAVMIPAIYMFSKVLEDVCKLKFDTKQIALFAAATLAFLPIAGAIAIATIGHDWASILSAGTMMGLSIVAISGALSILSGLDTSKLISASIALVAASGGLVIIAQAMKTFTDVNWPAVGMACVTLAALVGVLYLLGVGSATTLIGAAALTIASVALIAVSGAMWIAAQAFSTFAPALASLASVPIAEIASGLVPLSGSLLLLSAAGVALSVGSLGLGLFAAYVTPLATGLILLSRVGDISHIPGPLAKIGAAGVALGLGAPGMMIAGSAMKVVAAGVDVLSKSVTKASVLIANGINLITTSLRTGAANIKIASNSIGINVGAGMVNGISSAIPNVIKSASKLASGVFETIKSVLGIHSPSTKTTWAGQMTATGFKNGVTASSIWSGIKAKVSSLLNSNVLSPMSNAISKLKGAFTSLGSTVKNGDWVKHIPISAQNALSNVKDLYNGTFDLESIFKDIIPTEEELSVDTDAMSSSMDGAAEALGGAGGAAKETQDAFSKLRDNIASQMDIFSEFQKKTELTSDKLLENMRSQIKGVADWSYMMATLAVRGIDQGLLQKLADMGPQGYEYVNAFIQMTDDQLSEANKLYAQSLMMPDASAKSIMNSFNVAGMWATQGFTNGLDMEKFRASGQEGANAVRDGLEGKNGLQINSPSRVMYQNGIFTVLGLVNGIEAQKRSRLIPEMQSVANTVINTFKIFAGKDKFYEIGAYLIQGLINGMESKRGDLITKAEGIANTVTNKIASALKIKSPSRVMMKLGGYVTEGLAIGIEKNQYMVDSASENLANTAITGLKDAINAVSNMDDLGVNLNPTITPVLDLSNIEKGSAEIDKISSSWDGMQVGVSSNLASNTATSFNRTAMAKVSAMNETQNGLDMLKSAINALGNSDAGMTQNNTFNISGDDPRAIADEVSRVLQMQVERRGAVWA